MPGEGEWSPESWREKEILQQPSYDDPKQVESVEKRLKALPPLVSSSEIELLRTLLTEVQNGKRFLLLGGDCAERFMDCTAGTIERKMKILLQMSLIIIWGSRLPVVRIGRIAGQYSKPRSAPTEIVDGKEVKCFKGDSINSFDCSNREHDPERLISMYFHSGVTLNYIRALMTSGFSDLHKSAMWDLGYVQNPENEKEYKHIVKQITDGLSFMETVGMNSDDVARTVNFFTAHEGLVLAYESALTRCVDDKYFNLSAHFIWIGDRTRQLTHAHVEYCSGIQNPIGIKVGPSSDPEELVQIINRINPDNESGKVVLITRLSAARVDELLPNIVRVVRGSGVNVIWQCDPMHGNTVKTENGTKTRNFDTILKELSITFDVHRRLGSHLGGVHFELTGDDVTECIGGPSNLSESNLEENYTSYCDPRLNYGQSMAMAFQMVKMMGVHKEDHVDFGDLI